MARFFPTVCSAWSEGRNRLTRPAWARRARHRLRPGAETLEVRDCPSGLAPSGEVHHPAHVALLAHRDAQRHQPVTPINHHDPYPATPLQRKALARGQTIYVKPGGKSGANAGKTPARPLGSLVAAVKRAKPGTTIILAPGTYTENVFLTKKSNITIIGAADQSSILAPPSNAAIQVNQSSNITIDNVWFRSQGSRGVGLAVVGSSVTLQNIKTDGNQGDGVLVTGFAGRPGVLNATASHFDSVQTGSGLDLDDAAIANIDGSTFNNNGTSPAATQSSNGIVLFGAAQANITNSHFDGNTNAGMVATDHAQVTVQGSTFNSNKYGNGMLVFGQVTVNLFGNTFASNGTPDGVLKLGGVEFYGEPNDPTNYTGAAVLSGNVFEDNTLYGIYIGSAPQAIQILNNRFDNNVVGIFLTSVFLVNGGSVGPVNTTIQGNTIDLSVPTSDFPDIPKGIIAYGNGVTATIGGNTLENYDYSALAPNNGFFILESLNPNLTIQGDNTFTSGGITVPESNATINTG